MTPMIWYDSPFSSTVDPTADGFRCEQPRPETVRDDDDVFVPGLVVVALNHSAGLRRHAEHVEPVSRDALAGNALGVAACTGQVRAEIRLDGDRLEAARLVAIIAEARRRDRALPCC